MQNSPLLLVVFRRVFSWLSARVKLFTEGTRLANTPIFWWPFYPKPWDSMVLLLEGVKEVWLRACLYNKSYSFSSLV